MPCAVTPQGRVSFALSVREDILFVLIRFSLCFCFFLSGMFHEKWLRLAFEYSSPSGSEFYIIDCP